MTKYQAVEQALNILGSAGYDMETDPYRALAIEFGKLVQKRDEPNPALDMLKAKQEAAASRVRIRIVPMNSMYPIHFKK